VIPEIEIWRAANEELAADGDLAGVAVLAADHRRNRSSRDHDLPGLCIRRLFGRTFPLIE
jgi:hypothetical protein